MGLVSKLFTAVSRFNLSPLAYSPPLSLVFTFHSPPCLVLPPPLLVQSRVPLKSILNLRSYNLERTLELLDQVNRPPSLLRG